MQHIASQVMNIVNPFLILSAIGIIVLFVAVIANIVMEDDK